jgi:hypothetical protein
MSDAEQLEKFRKALERIADYDGESIWMDSRDDAADDMLSIARVALGREKDYE